MLKRRLRTILDHVASLSGLLDGLERRMRAGLTVLMYHRVLPADACAHYPLPTLAMPEEAFAAQAEWLARHAHVLPLREAVPLAGEVHEKPLVAITFDDGYADNARVAAPILEAAGLRATFFTTTDFIAGEAMWFDRACDLWSRVQSEERRAAERSLLGRELPAKGGLGAWLEALKALAPDERRRLLAALIGDDTAPPPTGCEPMTPDELVALAAAGHEIGAHTCSHPILPQLGDGALDHELNASRARLAKWLGDFPASLAYPNGDNDARVRAAAERAGYRFAVTTRPGRFEAGADEFAIPRRDITPGAVTDHRARFDPTAFRAELASFHQLLR